MLKPKIKTRIINGVIMLLMCLTVTQVRAAEADVTMYLEVNCPATKTCPDLLQDGTSTRLLTTLNQGEIFSLNIKLKNPSRQVLKSVQSWLQYDSSKFEGLKIETYNNFDLVAPGEKDFADNKVKIGLANTSNGVSDIDILVAKVTFRVKDNLAGESAITFYDYQYSELGHTKVNIIEEGFSINVLAEPPMGLVIPIGEGGVGGPTDTIGFINPPDRPINLGITTGNSYAYLSWEKKSGLGYKIFYGNTSGYYLHSKDVGSSDNFYVTNLSNDLNYYFALKAYNTRGIESEYSDEVAVSINHPETATVPINSVPQDLDKTKTGPSLVLFLALFAGSIGYIFSRRYSVSSKY